MVRFSMVDTRESATAIAHAANGYSRMVEVCRTAAELEDRVRHPVPSLPIRRKMAGGVLAILEECQTSRGECLLCGDLKPCTDWWDKHFCHSMEEPDARS